MRIMVPLPLPDCSPNVKGHWTKKANAVKTYRQECWVQAHNAKLRQEIKTFDKPVIIDQEWFYGPTKDKRYRPRDEDNARASIKAATDSLKDAKIIKDDGTKFVTWGTFKANKVKKDHQNQAGVLLTIREIE